MELDATLCWRDRFAWSPFGLQLLKNLPIVSVNPWWPHSSCRFLSKRKTCCKRRQSPEHMKNSAQSDLLDTSAFYWNSYLCFCRTQLNTNSLTTDSYTDSLSVRWNWISVWNFCFRVKLRITSTSKKSFITIAVHIKSYFLGPVYTWHEHILGYPISGHVWVQAWMHPRCCEDTLRSHCFDHIQEVVRATYGYIILAVCMWKCPGTCSRDNIFNWFYIPRYADDVCKHQISTDFITDLVTTISPDSLKKILQILRVVGWGRTSPTSYTSLLTTKS